MKNLKGNLFKNNIINVKKLDTAFKFAIIKSLTPLAPLGNESCEVLF